MALRIDPTYRNRSKRQQNFDKWGQMWWEYTLAQIASGRARFKGMGDGLSAYTVTPGENIMTGNGGLGYGSNWFSAANTISNPLAWWNIQFLDRDGQPTGMELQIQRGADLASGDVGNTTSHYYFVIGFAWPGSGGFTGTPDATTPFTTGGEYIIYNDDGTTSSWGSQGTNLAKNIISENNPFSSTSVHYTADGTMAWQVWSDDGQGLYPASALICYEGSSSDRGWVFCIENLVDCAASDPYPLLVIFDTFEKVSGETANEIDFFTGGGSVASRARTKNASGSTVRARAVSISVGTPTSPNQLFPRTGTNYLSNTAWTADADGNKPIYPVMINCAPSVGVPAQYKGICESLEFFFPESASQLFPYTLFADAEHDERPRLSLGWLLMPWEVGLSVTNYATSVSPANGNAYRRIQAHTAAPDLSPPVIGPFTPAPGTPITRDQAVSFPITDNSGQFAVIAITALFPSTGAWEVVWMNGRFAPYYSKSTRAPTTGGHIYTVRRSFEGWLASPRFIIEVADRAGRTN